MRIAVSCRHQRSSRVSTRRPAGGRDGGVGASAGRGGAVVVTAALSPRPVAASQPRSQLHSSVQSTGDQHQADPRRARRPRPG